MKNRFKVSWDKKTRVPIDGNLMELLVDLTKGDPRGIKDIVERGVLLAAKERILKGSVHISTSEDISYLERTRSDLYRIERLETYLKKRDRPLEVVWKKQ